MVEQKFTKSGSNRRSENAALRVLLTDLRFQAPDLLVKRSILELLELPADRPYGTNTFDAVMTPAPVEPITLTNLEQHLPDLTLVEMKATRAKIQDERLNRFFFGATENEFAMARDLGDRYLFAMVVLNDDNKYQRPFATLLTLSQLEERFRAKRMQWQINLRSDMTSDVVSHEVVVLGEPEDIEDLPSA